MLKNINLNSAFIMYGPLMDALKKQGFRAADMHFHTRFSFDGLAHTRNVVKKADKMNIGLAVTDHNEFRGAEKICRQRKELFIPGIEVSCHEGAHLLLYFYDLSEGKEFYEKEIKPQKKHNPYFMHTTYREVLEISKKYNCLSSIAHPYLPATGLMKVKIPKKDLDYIFKNINFIEGLNGALVREMNLKALDLIKKHKKPVTAGTDGHMTVELGRVLCFAQGDDRESFFKSIKKNKNFILGKEESLLPDVYHHLKAELKYVRDAGELGWIKQELKLWGRRLQEKGEDILNIFHVHHHARTQSVAKENFEALKKNPHFKHVLKHRK